MVGTEEINNSQDIIDSRDIEERIKYLSQLGKEADEDEENELKLLQDLKEQAGTSEWEDGVALIRESYFEEYAEELARDTGAIEREYQWPLNHIDWEGAAEELLIDYSSIDFNGATYYFRS